MGQVVLLHVGHVGRKLRVVKTVKGQDIPRSAVRPDKEAQSGSHSRPVHAIVADVERESARDNTVGHPAGEDHVRQVGEGVLKDEKHDWRHDQTKGILFESTRSKR